MSTRRGFLWRLIGGAVASVIGPKVIEAVVTEVAVPVAATIARGATTDLSNTLKLVYSTKHFHAFQDDGALYRQLADEGHFHGRSRKRRR